MKRRKALSKRPLILCVCLGCLDHLSLTDANATYTFVGADLVIQVQREIWVLMFFRLCKYRVVHRNYYWQQKNLLLSPVVFFLNHPVQLKSSLKL